jgi:hypothetical protein
VLPYYVPSSPWLTVVSSSSSSYVGAVCLVILAACKLMVLYNLMWQCGEAGQSLHDLMKIALPASLQLICVYITNVVTV